jgi:hypothetical protein
MLNDLSDLATALLKPVEEGAGIKTRQSLLPGRHKEHQQSARNCRHLFAKPRYINL